MIRIVFATAVALYGLIYFAGFCRAFRRRVSTYESQKIPHGRDLLCLAVSFLFLLAATFIMLGRDWWHIGFCSVLLSQMIIFYRWKEAKWFTAANVVVAIMACVNFAGWNFMRVGRQDAAELFARDSQKEQRVDYADIAAQPSIIKKWLLNSGAVNKPYAHTVRLKQTGILRTKPGSGWMPMRAEQYFTIDEPSFIWLAKINTGIFHISGIDKYVNNKGTTDVRLASIVPIEHADGSRIDQGTMVRYLAEIQWFPSSALSPCIKWSQTSDTTARATMSYGGLFVTGIFFFNKSGEVIAFETERYMKRNGQYTLQKWHISVTDYQEFDGIKIPSKGIVTWKLSTGDFEWFHWQIADLSYNTKQPY